MPHLLHLDSSADPRTSSSREVTAAFVRGWVDRGTDFSVASRNLHTDPPPHLPDAALHRLSKYTSGARQAGTRCQRA